MNPERMAQFQELDVHFVNPTPVHSGLGKVYNWGHCHVLDLFPLS